MGVSKVGMVDPAIQRHLDQLGKPLQYAMRHNFAHLAKLRALEPYIQHQISALQSQPLAAPLPPLLHELAQTVRGFDALDLPQKQTRLVQVQELLTRLQATAAAPAEPAQPAVIDSPTLAPPVLPPQHSNASPSVAADALTQPVQYVRGVGPKRAALLAKLNLHTVTDLLWCLPIRYEDRRHLTPLGLLRIGQRQTFYGIVKATQSVPQRRGKPLFTLTLEDNSGTLYGKWFQTRGAYLQERFPVGAMRRAKQASASSNDQAEAAMQSFRTARATANENAAMKNAHRAAKAYVDTQRSRAASRTDEETARISELLDRCSVQGTDPSSAATP
jgi:hypothetical protein